MVDCTVQYPTDSMTKRAIECWKSRILKSKLCDWHASNSIHVEHWPHAVVCMKGCIDTKHRPRYLTSFQSSLELKVSISPFHWVKNPGPLAHSELFTAGAVQRLQHQHKNFSWEPCKKEFNRYMVLLLYLYPNQITLFIFYNFLLEPSMGCIYSLNFPSSANGNINNKFSFGHFEDDTFIIFLLRT